MPGPANALNINEEGLVYFNGTNDFSGIPGVTAGFVLTDGGAGMPGSYQAIQTPPLPIKPVDFAASPYTVLPADKYLEVDASGGAISIVLEAARANGVPLVIKDAAGQAGTNNITLSLASGGALIDGSATFVMSTNYESIGVVFDGTNYEIYAAYNTGGGSSAYYSLTPYIVGPDANSQYTTIQAAITQAISDGASDSNPKNIYVKPKSAAYAENLTGAAGIRIIGLSIPTPPQRPIGTNFPRQGVVWTGVCTWASGCMSFQNIQTGYAGSGDIWTIPASGKLILQNCNLINVGAGGVFIATSGSGANLEINSCIPTTVGTLINTTDTGLIVQMQNCAVANGGSINAVGGQWYFSNCQLDAFFIIGNTEAYVLEMNYCNAVDGFQFRADTNTQTTNVIKGNFCSFNESGTSIKTNKVSNFSMTNCGGTVGNLVDDSAGSGNTFNFFSCGFNTGTLVSLGSGSSYGLYNTLVGQAPNTVINSVAVSTSGSDGFLHTPSCAGTPVGTPTLFGDATPFVYDSTNKIGYVYAGGAWNPMGGSGGSAYSLSPYICGPTGDANAQFTGDTAIADALAQIVTDAPSSATLFIKAGAYASSGFTIPDLGFPIVFIGETLPPGSLQDHSGIGSALQPQVIFQGPITGTGACAMQFIQLQGAITSHLGSQFEWCSFQSGGTFTISDSIRCQFSQCYIGGSVSSISNKYLLASFDKCHIDTSINTVSGNGDYFLFTDCYFTSQGTIVNTATSGPGMEAYNCRVDSSTWVDESNATHSFSTMKINGITTGNSVSYLFRLKPSVGWGNLNNIAFYGTYLVDDTSGTGGNTLSFDNCVMRSSFAGFNLSDNDSLNFYNSILSGGFTAGTNCAINLFETETNLSNSLGSGSSVNYYGSSTTSKNFIVNTDSVSTSATDGFLHLPACAGTPTGTPTAMGDSAPMVYDSTNKVGYAYAGGAWNAMGGGGAAGGWVLLDRQEGSTITNITFTSYNTTDYDDYVLVIDILEPLGGAADIIMQVSTNNGVSWVDSIGSYGGGITHYTIGATALQSKAYTNPGGTDPVGICVTDVGGSDPVYLISAVLYCHNFCNNHNFGTPGVQGTGCGLGANSGTDESFCSIYGLNTNFSTPINGIRFIRTDGGTINRGQVTLYGLKEF